MAKDVGRPRFGRTPSPLPAASNERSNQAADVAQQTDSPEKKLRSAAAKQARRLESKRLSQLNDEDLRRELRGMSPTKRAQVLKDLPSTQRMLLLGSSAVHGAIHDTGPTFEPDWGSLPLKRGYNPTDAWAMAVAAKRAYEPFSADGKAENTQSVKDLIRAGYQVKLLGSSSSTTQGFVATKGDKAIVAFRGTEPGNFDDYATDADFTQVPGYGGAVHAGFDKGLDQVWGDLKAGLASAQSNLKPPGQKLSVHLTGHSLGAALATLAASRIQDELSGVASVNGVYTFGSP